MKTIALSLILIVTSCAPAFAGQDPPSARDRVVTVMTRNVYTGVVSFPDLLLRVAAVYQA